VKSLRAGRPLEKTFRKKRRLRTVDKIILKCIFKKSAVGCGMHLYGSSIDQGRAIIVTVMKFWIKKKSGKVLDFKGLCPMDLHRSDNHDIAFTVD
jgi:hypothetical protein